MTPITAHRIGDVGYAAYARALYRLGVLDRDEWLGLVTFHAAVMVASRPPDAEDGADDHLLDAFVRELGATLE
jgi:hypothetical protein